MRQTTPFNGVLTPEERIDAIYRARASFEQGHAMTREVSALKGCEVRNSRRAMSPRPRRTAKTHSGTR
jgi:hypothetical protein